MWPVVLGGALSLTGGMLVAAWNHRMQQRTREAAALTQLFDHLIELLRIVEEDEQRGGLPRDNDRLPELRWIARVASIELTSRRTEDLALGLIGLSRSSPAVEIEELLDLIRTLLNPRIAARLFKPKYRRRAYGHSLPEEHD